MVVGFGFTFVGLAVVISAMAGKPLHWENGGPMSLPVSIAVGITFMAAGGWALVRPDHRWIDLDGNLVCGWTDDSHTFRSRHSLDEYDRVILETNVYSAPKPNCSDEGDDDEDVNSSDETLVEVLLYLEGAKSRVLLELFEDDSEAFEAGGELSAVLGLPLNRTMVSEHHDQ